MEKNEKQAYNRQYFQGHKSEIYARRQSRNAERRQSLRAFLEEQKQGKVCQRCGLTDSRLLEFRYQDEQGNAGNLKNKAVSMNWSKERILQELEHCSLLCWNCRKLVQ